VAALELRGCCGRAIIALEDRAYIFIACGQTGLPEGHEVLDMKPGSLSGVSSAPVMSYNKVGS
jgi:hypothetical protein